MSTARLDALTAAEPRPSTEYCHPDRWSQPTRQNTTLLIEHAAMTCSFGTFPHPGGDAHSARRVGRAAVGREGVSARRDLLIRVQRAGVRRLGVPGQDVGDGVGVLTRSGWLNEGAPGWGVACLGPTPSGGSRESPMSSCRRLASRRTVSGVAFELDASRAVGNAAFAEYLKQYFR
jgi:hypothetical protein